MIKRNRRFYVIYVEDRYARAFLDTIRYLANPSEKTSAHITVRGPYYSRHRPVFREGLKGSVIKVTDIGTFFEGDQNTVFLAVEAPQLIDYWFKPSYPDFTPHLTLYDGESRSFAEKLASICKEFLPAVRFCSTELSPLSSSSGQMNADLASFYDRDLVLTATGQDLPPGQVLVLPDHERLEVIRELAKHWHQRDSNISCPT